MTELTELLRALALFGDFLENRAFSRSLRYVQAREKINLVKVLLSGQ